MRFLLPLLFGLLCNISCQNEPKTAASTPESPTVAPTNQPTFVDLPKRYLHLEGTIKNLPITMDLNFKVPPHFADSNGYYFGSYYYNKYQEPIELWQKTDTSGVLILNEKYAYDEDNKFVGNFDGLTFSGKWYDGYRQFSFPFSLEIVEADDVAEFDYISFLDTIKNESDPAFFAEYSLYSLWPTADTDSTKTAFLQAAIMKILSADQMENQAKTPEELFVQEKEIFFENYKKEVADLQQDGIGGNLNYALQKDLSVNWNKDDLVSIGAMTYEYMGGAHGNYGTQYYVLDVKNQQLLTEKDVFKANFKATIQKELKASAERLFDSDMNDYTPIDAINMDYLKANGNFFVTGGGVGYNFVPYEIGPYAIGEIQLFLPKEAIRSVLQPRFKERMGWTK